MEDLNKTNDSNIKNAETHADPALIPRAVFNAEGATVAASSSDMFVSGRVASDVFSLSTKTDLVDTVNNVQRIVDATRAEVTAQVQTNIATVGKGFRNYGFMIGSNQSINNFPQFAPNFIDINKFNDVVEDYLFLRDISERLLGISNDVRDMMNVFGNLGYEFSLAYYNNVRAIAERTKDKTAVSVFDILRQYFNRKRTPDMGGEPSEKKVERDIHAVLHGHKSGEVTVSGEEKHTATGGGHSIVDNTYKEKGGEFKETVSGAICPACGCENVNHARFCINCGGKLGS
jgi:hypothetical protein